MNYVADRLREKVSGLLDGFRPSDVGDALLRSYRDFRANSPYSFAGYRLGDFDEAVERNRTNPSKAEMDARSAEVARQAAAARKKSTAAKGEKVSSALSDAFKGLEQATSRRSTARHPGALASLGVRKSPQGSLVRAPRSPGPPGQMPNLPFMDQFRELHERTQRRKVSEEMNVLAASLSRKNP